MPRIAVFIDADNVHGPGIRYVFEKLTSEWNVTYRRAYGRRLMNRADIFRKYGILPIDVVSNIQYITGPPFRWGPVQPCNFCATCSLKFRQRTGDGIQMMD